MPSLTESLFDLGLGEAVVGITDYCIRPAGSLENIPRLGGPKNPRLKEIQALQPDLVLANWEENTRQVVEGLRAAGVSVWVTFPRTVRESLDILWQLVDLFHSKSAAVRIESLELTLEWARSAAASRPPVLYFCPVWYDRTSQGQPWMMTFNRHTYCHDLLAILGGHNAFAGRQRRFPLAADIGLEQPQDPGEKDTRYPRLALDEIIAAQPEVILLLDEPFAFSENHRQELRGLLASTPAVQHDRLPMVDGSLITWHGTRLAHALRELPSTFDIL